MIDETMFINFALDMTALEATMTIYEYEHGLTPEYLASGDDADVYDDDIVTESADSMFAGLFEDDFAPATEGFKETMSNIGKGIKSAMITIVGAIKKAFITLGNTISGFFSKAIETHQRKSAENDPYVRALLRDANVSACADRASKTFKTLTTMVASANVQILPIVNKINKILNAAAIGNKKDYNASEDELRKIGQDFKYSYGSKNLSKVNTGNGNNFQALMEKGDAETKAEADITDAETTLNNLAKELKDAQSIISNKDAQDTSTIEKVLKSVATGNKAHGIARNSKGEEKETKGERKITPALVQKAIFAGINVSTMHAMSKQVTAACSQHAKACEGIVKNCEQLHDNGTGEVKKGYRLCQIYMRASKYFSQISMLCSKVISFKATDVKDLGTTGIDRIDGNP